MTAPAEVATCDEVGARAEVAARRRTTRFAAEGGISMAWGMAVYATSLLTGPMLARALGPEGRGELASVVAPAQVLAFVLGFGVPGACAYFAHSRSRSLLLGSSIATSVLLAAPISLALWFAAPLYLADRDPMTVTAFRLLAVQALVTIVAQATNERRRALEGAGATYNLLRSLPILLNAVAVTVLFTTGNLHLATALVAVVGGVVAADVLTLLLADLARPVFRRSAVRETWSFGLRSWVGTLSNAMSGRLDQVLLVGMASSAQLGRYAVAVSAANVTIPIGQGAASAVLPHLRRGGLGSWSELVRAVLVVGAIATAVSALVGLAAPFVLPFLFGEGFRDALVPLLVLLPGQVAGAMAEVLRADLASRGRPGQGSVCQGIAAAVTVVLIVPAVQRYDITGAAATTTIAYVAMAISAAVLAHRDRRPDRPPTSDGRRGRWRVGRAKHARAVAGAVLAAAALAAGCSSGDSGASAEDAEDRTVEQEPAEQEPTEAPGRFLVDGSTIVGPDGEPFVPRGVNLLGPQSFWPDETAGLSDAVRDWGLNTVRLNTCLPGGCEGADGAVWDANDDLDALVDEFTDAGLVVIISLHQVEPGGYPDDAAFATVAAWWRETAARYADNPGVWFNLLNEPGHGASVDVRWRTVHERLVEVVREVAPNLILLDGTQYGQEAGTDRTRPVTAETSAILRHGQALAGAAPDIAFSVHVYDRWEQGDDVARFERLRGFVDDVRALGLALVIGETGGPADEPDGPLADASRTAYAVAGALDVGLLAWHGQAGDDFGLLVGDDGARAELDELGTADLTWQGQLLWDLANDT